MLHSETTGPSPRVRVADLSQHVGERVTVCGWVQVVRRQRRIQFLILRDSSGLVQITNRRNGGPLEQVLEDVTVESAIRVTGELLANSVVDLGGLEIIPENIEVLAAAEPVLPIDAESGIEHRLDWRHLDIRLRPQARMVFDVQTTVEQAMREFVYKAGFTEMHTPKLMGTASESGAEVFALDYFEKKAYLAQSPQFYKQTAIASGIEGVFEIGPVFRAEPSFSSRHATEFTGVDVEMAWVESVEEVMGFEERMLTHVLEKVSEKHGARISELFGVGVVVPEFPFPRISMSEALAQLRATGWDPAGVREDLNAEGERLFGEWVLSEFGHQFVFLTDFPVSVRPFYHMLTKEDPSTTASFDLLWKGVEITTGAQREHRYNVLIEQAAGKGLSPEPMSSYLNVFRHGCPPHGGFGLGLARLLMLMLGLPGINESTFLFRGPNRLEP